MKKATVGTGQATVGGLKNTKIDAKGGAFQILFVSLRHHG